MAKKKLSEVNAVANLGDNDYITCIMQSSGEVVKVKKSDLLPLSSSSNDGLMSRGSHKKLNNSIPFNSEAYMKFYILTTASDQGVCGIVSISSYNSAFVFSVQNGIAGGGSTNPTTLHYSPMILNNQGIASLRIYKRGSQNIIEVVVTKSVSYGDFSFFPLYKTTPNISVDTSYAYNSSTDTNLINAVISTNS